MKRTRRFALLLLFGVAAYALYVYFVTRGRARTVLHPAVVEVRPRPTGVSGDLEHLYPEIAASQIAIFLTRVDPSADTPARCLNAMGLPFFVTNDLQRALHHRLVILYPDVDARTFDASQAAELTEFVTRGGTVFAQDVFWGGFKPLFGFEDFTPLRTRHKIVFDGGDPDPADPVLKYLNRREEREVPLGSPEIKEVIWSNGYRPAAGTKTLGRFEDGSAAMLRRDVGRGHAYLIGVSLADVVLRNQQNRDYEAQRVYANGFEPGTDVWLLILRAWYEAYAESGVRLSTIPEGNRSVLMLSHDVDWEYSIEPILRFAQLEKESGTSATYFVQTKYLDDATSRAFFFAPMLAVLRAVAAGRSDIESHTVAHSDWFNKVPLGTGEERYPTYRSRATRTNQAQDTTTLGEVCVSKSLLDGELPGHTTTFFRAGHLKVPPYLPEALARCGYEFDSSFTAGDVLGSFPYELNLDLGMTEPSTILEFPVTFEDEESPRLMDRVTPLLDTVEANAENGAPTVLLIHTNNAKDKLEAERAILSRLPRDILVENMIEYARFWKARSRVRWSTRPVAGGEEIEIAADLPVSGLTLSFPGKIRTASGAAGIRYSDHDAILPPLGAHSHVVIRVTYDRQ